MIFSIRLLWPSKERARTAMLFAAGRAFEPKNADNTPNTGYYLFLTDDTGIGQLTENKKNTGTSPIFAVVGGHPWSLPRRPAFLQSTRKFVRARHGESASDSVYWRGG